MLSAIFTSVADALISYAIDKLDPAESIKSWLKLDPTSLAFQKALARAYSAFARQYPEYTSSLFDQSFLITDALPELSKLLTRNQHPDPALLAQAWGRSIGVNADFAQTVTKPAAYFLDRFEAELKVEPALQSLFDSRALESLPKLDAELQKLSAELQRGLDTAMKAANGYQIQVGGSVGGNIIIGDNNVINSYYFTGDFISLNEYYIPPDGVFQRVRVDEFVGRDWLTAKVDAFLNDPHRKSGAFLLIGDAGVGKTTFMAHLVKEHRYLHLFAEQAPGQAMLQRAMQSLGSQLVTRYQIDPYKDRDTLNALSVFPDFLERILRLAASTLTEGEKIVIVCDALDEAGTFPDHFVFGLPKELPDGVYFILSQRPVNVKLPNFEPVIEKLEAQGEGNLQDIESYLSAVAKRPEVAGQIRSKEYSEDFFIQTLKEKSQGVWMYLHYIIKEIESGARAPLDLANLPTGLVGYYAEYWDAWRTGKRGKGEETWDELYAPLLTTLAATQEAITVKTLIQWAGVTVTPREATRLLTEHWRAFITEKEVDGKKAYAPYHLSFKDFITGRGDTDKLPPAQANLVKDLASQTVDTHKRIVNAFEEECKGEWEKLVEQEYPRLHLSAHLAGAQEYKILISLLTEGDEHIQWAEMRYKIEETYAGYLSDLTYVWGYAEREQNYALAIRCMLIENSIHSLISNISPELLAQLAKAGLWSYARCLSAIREYSNSNSQAEALGLIIPHLPPILFQDALATASEIKDLSDRISAMIALTQHIIGDFKIQAIKETLVALAPHLNQEFKIQVFQDELAAACEIKNETSRAEALAELALRLNTSIKLLAIQESLDTMREMKNERDCVRTLIDVAPHLDNEELKSQALAVARELKDETDHVLALVTLMPHLNEDIKTQVLREALAAAREIKDESDRATASVALAPYLNDTPALKSQALQEALVTVREIRVDILRGDSLVSLMPYLDEELIIQALAVARDIKYKQPLVDVLTALTRKQHLSEELKLHLLAVAREIEDEYFRFKVLVVLAPHLNETLKIQVLQDALAATRGIKDEINQAEALAALMPYLNDKLKSQVLATACEIEEESDRSEALAALAPHLNDDLKLQALITAREIKENYHRFWAMFILSLHLNDAQTLKSQTLQEALAAASEIKAEFHRVRTLAVLIPHLNEELKSKALHDALAAACVIKDIDGRVEALTALTLRLNEDFRTQALQETLASIREIDNDDARARALAILTSDLNDELKLNALRAASKIKDEYLRACTLADLTPYLSEDLKLQSLQEALIAAHGIKYEESCAEVLATLTPYLNDDLQLQALAIARKIKNDKNRASALGALLPQFNDELKLQILQETLAATREIMGDNDTRVRILMSLVPYFNEEAQVAVLQEALYLLPGGRYGPQKELLNTWEKIKFTGLKGNILSFIRSRAQGNRAEELNTFAAITPALIHFSGPDIAPELYRAIIDTARWWP